MPDPYQRRTNETEQLHSLIATGRLLPMTLAEIAETVPARKPGTPCIIATARESMGPADRATFDGFLTDHLKSSQWIADLLNRAYGLNVKAASVAYHRRGACRCRP